MLFWFTDPILQEANPFGKRNTGRIIPSPKFRIPKAD